MGIRFHCPNGHKMNVKAFLAGRRGLCPTCGEKFDIPFRSEPGITAGGSGEGQAPGDEAPDESTDTIVVDLPYLTSPPDTPSEPWASEPAIAGHQADVGSTPHSLEPAGAISISDAAPLKKEPVAPLPAMKWYIRIGTGEQFGPVRDEQVRQWFDEKRILANTPIWRDGWADWQAASTVFRSQNDLVPTPPQILAASRLSSTDPSYAFLPDQPAPLPNPQQVRTWTQKQWTLVISVIMLLLIVILGTILLLMLLGAPPQPEPQSPQPPAAKTPLSDAGYLPNLLASSGRDFPGLRGRNSG